MGSKRFRLFQFYICHSPYLVSVVNRNLRRKIFSIQFQTLLRSPHRNVLFNFVIMFVKRELFGNKLCVEIVQTERMFLGALLRTNLCLSL